MIFGEADGLEERENSGEELAEGVVSEERRCADGVVAFGVLREGVDPAVDVHGAEGREIFRYGLFAGSVWHWRIVCLRRVSCGAAIAECQLIECGGCLQRPGLRWFR